MTNGTARDRSVGPGLLRTGVQQQATGSARVNATSITLRRSRLQRYSATLRRQLASYLFIAPALMFVAIFLLYPIVFTSYLSLFRWDGLHTPQFVGFANYMQLLTDPAFRTSFQNSLLWVVGTLLFPVGIGLTLAVVLSRLRLERGLKLLFYLPYALSPTSTAVLWGFLLDQQGALNVVLRAIGLEALTRSWLISPPWHTALMIAAYTWLTAGTNMVLFLVGLRTIPPETVEAARLDGATPWQEFWRIVFPQLRPITLVVVTIALANSFMVFDLIWVLTQGGPFRSSETLAVMMYRESFVLFRLGYGAAIAVLLSVIVLLLSTLYIRSMLRKEQY